MTGVRPVTATAGTGRAREAPPGSRRRVVLSAVGTCLLVGLLFAAYALAPWDRGAERSAFIQLALWLLVLVVVLVWQVRAVMRSAHPWLRAVQGAVIGLALLLVPFSVAYAGMSQSAPTTFTQPLTRIDALYFTVTVFSTVGFGDIAPVSQPARLLVTVQMLADLVLLGMVLKVLVGTAQRRREALGPRDRGRAAPR